MAIPRTDWADFGICREVGVEIFFPPSGADVNQATKICKNECPVQQECLDHGFYLDDKFGELQHGIFGGMTQTERRRLRRAKRSEAASKEDE